MLSAAFVERFGGIDYPSLEALLADPAIDAVVNLTSHGIHAEVTTAALEAGKHVHSEKPMAGSYAEARRLVELADAQGPAALVLADHVHGRRAGDRLEPDRDRRDRERSASSTPRSTGAGSRRGTRGPAPFYAIGPMADVGVYPLTILTAIFGPARRVTAHGQIVYPDRFTISGEPFTVGAPDFGVALIELADGTLVRLTTSFYVGQQSKQKRDRVPRRRRLAVHVELAGLRRRGRARALRRHLRARARCRTPSTASTGARALGELAAAIAEERPHRATGAHAAHVVEILDAVETSVREGGHGRGDLDVHRASELRAATRTPAPTTTGRSSRVR